MTVDSGQIPVKRFQRGQSRIIWTRIEGYIIRIGEILVILPRNATQIVTSVLVAHSQGWEGGILPGHLDADQAWQMPHWLFAAVVKEFWVLFTLFYFVSLTLCTLPPWVAFHHMGGGNHPVFSGTRTGFLKKMSQRLTFIWNQLHVLGWRSQLAVNWQALKTT